MKREMKIGAFMAGTLIILAIFLFIVGDIGELLKKPGYVLNVLIDSALGLEKSSSVKMAGIKIGYVKDIRLNQRRAQIIMNIYPQYKVPRGSKATMSSLGLLGERFMEIVPSRQDSYFGPDETMEGLPAVSFDQIGNLFLSIGDEIRQTGESLREMVDKKTSADFKQTIENLSSLTAELNGILARNKNDIGQTVKDASQTVKDLSRRFQEISENINKAAGQFGGLAEENRDGVKKSLERIQELISKLEESVSLLNKSLEKITTGEGTLGKLINEPALYEDAEKAIDSVRQAVNPVMNLRAGLELGADYYHSSELFFGRLSFGLRVNGNKLFLGQIAHDPWRDRFVYSLQGGLRWGRLVPRAGIIDSEFGAGLDYYALKDKLAFSVEAFAFNRSPRPQLRIFTKYYPQKNIFFVVGLNDFVLASKRELYFGLGLCLR